MLRIVAVVMLFTTSLQAQGLRAQDLLNHITFDVGAGYSFPLNATADHTKNGFSFAASAGPRLSGRLRLTLDFSLHYLDVKNSLQEPMTGIDLSLGSMVRIWSLTVNPSYEFIKKERFTTYATVGSGLYNRR